MFRIIFVSCIRGGFVSVFGGAFFFMSNFRVI